MGTFDINDYASSISVGPTLNEFCSKFLDYREKLVHIGQLSDKTLIHDRYALQLLSEYIDDTKTINNLTSDDVVNFIVQLKDSVNKNGKPFKPGAINSYLKHLKAAFNWALKEKLIIESPFKDVGKLPDPDENKYRYISEEDIERIRVYLVNKPMWQLDIFNLCLGTGARRDEVFNIKKQNLYVDDIKTTMIHAKTDDELKAVDIKKVRAR